MRAAPLADVCEIVMGQAPKGNTYNTAGVGLPLIAGAGDFGDLHPAVTKYTTADRVRTCRAGDIVLSIRASIGTKVLADGEYCLGRGVAGLRARSHLDDRYLWHWTTAAAPELTAKGRGATFLQVNKADISKLEIPLPPIDEQRRIAAVLDAADALRAKRREALAKLDTLAQAIFIDMFGDPAANPMRWPTMPLGRLALKFSDGPFGSNLKSDHYQDSGVRVVRLQNIGSGEFVDDVAAYISDEHFTTLRKHECRPGDVLVATMGDPNLRACIQPGWLNVALNKADCVQIRVDPTIATNHWLCVLLNHPSTEDMARSLVRGQTRSRISMGRLRELEVPVPPVDLQDQFGQRRTVAMAQTQRGHESSTSLNRLFGSLQQRAFRGEL